MFYFFFFCCLYVFFDLEKLWVGNFWFFVGVFESIIVGGWLCESCVLVCVGVFGKVWYVILWVGIVRGRRIFESYWGYFWVCLFFLWVGDVCLLWRWLWDIWNFCRCSNRIG